MSYGAPETPSNSYGLPSSNYGTPTTSFGAPSNLFDSLSSSYGAPSSSYDTPSSSYGAPSVSDTYGSPSNRYETVVKFDDTQSEVLNKHSTSSATNKPASPFDQTAYQKMLTNAEVQQVPAVYKGDEGMQHPVSQTSTFSKYQSQTSTSSSKDNLSPNYFESLAGTFGNKIRQRDPLDSTDTAYSDRQDNPAANPLQNTGHVKFPDTQSAFSPSIKQWEASSEQRSGSSRGEVKQR
jgi:hypothetical protein